MLLVAAAALELLAGSADAAVPDHRPLQIPLSTKTVVAWSYAQSRRQALLGFACGAVSSVAPIGPFGSPPSAAAFPNKISNQYDDRIKQRGSAPPDLGVRMRETSSLDYDEDSGTARYLGLKPCKASPNCFCSTTSREGDPDHWIPPFVWPKELDQAAAMRQLQDILEAYQPGQNDVDGGGFAIQTVRPDYIYVQYESLKNGYIDDAEFAIIDNERYGEREVQVRSSSRLGYADFGVNAKRINAIAAALRQKSWNAPGVDYATHTFYAAENRISP